MQTSAWKTPPLRRIVTEDGGVASSRTSQRRGRSASRSHSVASAPDTTQRAAPSNYPSMLPV
jgi:hypothetical protein